MSGAGKKDVVGTYLTVRRTYRDVTSADTDIDAIDEVIDTRVDQDGKPVTTGANSLLALFVLLGGPTAATIHVYAKATDEEAAESGSSSSPSGTAEWAFNVEKTVDTKNLMTALWPLPAGIYKVMVTSITGSGTVTIRESHSA